ncbi:hypothetical protein ACFWMS_25320 [Peribacillus butanolivorans]|uniref:hypothetical protein n=1 Tax=Peribacillus butanolivorans TaxID=421767 RepID=UPI003666FDE0
MKTCPYCGSNLEKMDTQYYCDFCCMNLDPLIVKTNGERIDIRVNEAALDVHIEKTTPELMTLSTFELLYLLKAIRKERSEMYSYMNTFYKAGQQQGDSEDFKEYEISSGKDYMHFTKKAFVVENIIRTRLGYVPTRITESYLARYLESIKNDKKAPMIIKTERQKK